MAKDEPTFEIRTGPYNEKVTAPSLDRALADFWAGKDQSKAGDLMMFREIPWNSEYKWDPGDIKRRGRWHYLMVPNGDRGSAA